MQLLLWERQDEVGEAPIATLPLGWKKLEAGKHFPLPKGQPWEEALSIHTDMLGCCFFIGWGSC